jgi:hypothetical protein
MREVHWTPRARIPSKLIPLHNPSLPLTPARTIAPRNYPFPHNPRHLSNLTPPRRQSRPCHTIPRRYTRRGYQPRLAHIHSAAEVTAKAPCLPCGTNGQVTARRASCLTRAVNQTRTAYIRIAWRAHGGPANTGCRVLSCMKIAHQRTMRG